MKRKFNYSGKGFLPMFFKISVNRDSIILAQVFIDNF
jgi:hypothetical protein